MKINNNCVGCGQCTAFCKIDAIVIKGKARITDACINCGICATYCPMMAIEVDE